MNDRTRILLLAAVLLVACGGFALLQPSGPIVPARPSAEPAAVAAGAAEVVPPSALPVEPAEGAEADLGTLPVSGLPGPDDGSVRLPTGQTGTPEPADPGVVAGRILADDTGLPLGGVLVMLRNGSDRRKAVTDAEGEFRFEGVGPGMVQLVSFRKGYAFDFSVLLMEEGRGVAGSERALRSIPLSETGAIEGHVTDATGRAESGVGVMLHRASGPIGIDATTDESGKFEISGLPPGWYNLSVVQGESGLWMRTRNVLVVAGEVVVADIRGYGTLTGVVLDADGEPAAKALISVSTVDETGPRNIRATADGAGRYRLENAGLGQHRLWVYHQGSSAQIRFLALTGSDQEEDIRLPSGRLGGTVKGRGAQGCWVALFPADPAAKDQHPLANATTRGGGEFEFRWVPPGRYRLRAHRDGKPVAETRVEIPAVGEAEPVLLRID